MKAIAALWTLPLVALAVYASGLAAGPRPPALRVLFIGNSYTSVNDLPALIGRLAAADGQRLEATSEIPGGYTLQGHLQSGRAAALIAQRRWDWVVLQEQSQVPSFPRPQLERAMYPAARALVSAIRAAGARPLFYQTWARRDGDRDNLPGDGYAAMQARLDTGYGAIAHELQVPLAPVGPAWREALARRPGLPLWSEDGSHPSEAGSYLAACVLYHALFGRSPVGNSFSSGLDADLAGLLQQVAAAF